MKARLSDKRLQRGGMAFNRESDDFEQGATNALHRAQRAVFLQFVESLEYRTDMIEFLL